ncbi:hypothetical protein L208DRAFT_1420342 [Tricholoma matsutake]|nr:hypothetical protein L208DRAFT_1420342 [Tricholoma matsutake 945]
MLWFYQLLILLTSFKVLGLWADASQAEVKHVGTSDGQVYRLDATCAVKRGTNHKQTLLWPPQLAISAKQPNPPSIETLELKGVATTSRSIVLNLGPVSLKDHGFHVALALEFEEYVVVFLSNDMVFQVRILLPQMYMSTTLAFFRPLLFGLKIFDCPSHTAWLCDAFWEYAHVTHTEVP